MSKKSEKGQPDDEKLWKEHKACQNAALSLESPIWQTSSVIGIGLIGTLLLVANHAAKEQPPWQVAAVIGLYTSVASFIWWFMARRWWSIQHAMFIRMRYIEEALGVYSVRYVHYLDNPSTLSRSGLPKDEVEELRKRTEKRGLLPPSHQRRGIQAILWLFPIMNLVVWGLYTWWLSRI
jgi:hypothetical protein